MLSSTFSHRSGDTSGLSISTPACYTCKYWNSGTTCKVFKNGIPDTILSGGNNHEKPVSGDNGITYSPK